MTPDEAAAVVLERTVELSLIPAPSLDEGDRAAVVTGWWRSDGFEPHTDDAGNVLARLREGTGPATFVAAHLDTVFDRDATHGATARDGRLYGPGVGDNTVAVAALSLLDGLLPPRLERPLWVVATTGEEGLGNLTGASHLMAEPPARVDALIALEGNYLGRVATVAVGSIRGRVRLEGPGGHAWEAADRPSAIHDLARIITSFDAVLSKARERGRCSVNVGRIEGGEAINSRARSAAMNVDVRSDDPCVLADLEAAVRSAIAAGTNPGMRSTFLELGRRPAGSIPSGHALVAAADAALAEIGRTAEHVAASTDANAAYAAGVPAVTIGVTTGSDEHTPGEWIDVEPIRDGLVALSDTIVRYDRTPG